MGRRDPRHGPGASICTFATDTTKVSGHCVISSVAQSQRIRDTQGYISRKLHFISGGCLDYKEAEVRGTSGLRSSSFLQ